MKKQCRKQQQRSIKLKAGSLSRETKLTNHQPGLSGKNMEKTQNNKIRNEKGDVTTDNAEMQIILRGNYTPIKNEQPGING